MAQRKRSLDDRQKAYPYYEAEFGPIEGDTMIGKNHKNTITLDELIEQKLNNWFKQLPKNIFKSIMFDCGEGYSNWKSLSNQQDISILFADPGCPSQQRLNEH